MQWNGLVDPNFAIARNIGQFVGVFGSIDVADATVYRSSVRGDNMNNLETLITKLKAPLWPEAILPKIGPVEVGENPFQGELRLACHTSIDRATGQKVEADQDIAQMQTFAELGTDIWLSCNAFMHLSKTGILEGRPTFVTSDVAAAHR